MSKLTEYLALIPKGIKHPRELASGWLNVAREELGALPDDQLEEVVRRRMICNECPYASQNAVKTGYKSSRTDSHCTLCACPLKAKTASMISSCGIKYWNETHPTEQLDIKWGPYESNKS